MFVLYGVRYMKKALVAVGLISFIFDILDNKRKYEFIHECDNEPEYGDVIFCRRIVAAYKHFGIYIGGGYVIHFSEPDDEQSHSFDTAIICESSLEEFAKGDKVLVFNFPEKFETGHPLRHLQEQKDYHIYTPDETVQRAKSKLGTKGVLGDKYNPITNNCEHFATWCKTGIADCKQLNAYKDSFMKLIDKIVIKKKMATFYFVLNVIVKWSLNGHIVIIVMRNC